MIILRDSDERSKFVEKIKSYSPQKIASSLDIKSSIITPLSDSIHIDYSLDNVLIGYSDFIISDNILFWNYFHPLANYPELQRNGADESCQEKINNLKIGCVADYITLAYLHPFFETYNLVSSTDLRIGRAKFLEKIGVSNPHQPLPFKERLYLLKNYLGESVVRTIE